jgi:hypothetical protein
MNAAFPQRLRSGTSPLAALQHSNRGFESSPMKRSVRHRQSGSSLIVVMSITATLIVIAGIAAEYTTNITRNVQRSNTFETAIATGDSCLDILFGNWRSICRQPLNVNQALPTNSFTSIPLPTSSSFPNISNFGASTVDYYGTNRANPPAISNFKVVAADAEWSPVADPAATPIPMLGQTGAVTTQAIYDYIASADITLPTLKGNVVAKVRRVFQKQQISPWDFAIFYIDPLEIHPGPQFTVTGWVHTNSNLYTAHNTLHFAEKVTYASDWFINFMPGDRYHNANNDSEFGPPTYLPNLPPARDQALQPFGLDSTSIFNTNNPNTNDSYRELIEPPVAGYPDPLAPSERYWNQASVIIQVRDNPNPGAPGFDGVNGHDLVTIGTPNSDGTITPLSPSSSLYQMFSTAITTNQSIQDGREGAILRIASLDVSRMVTTVSNGNPNYRSSNFNAIVYVYDSSNSPSSRRAIRIKNGSKLPAGGFTLASNNAVYIQGDFNTGGTPASDGSPSDPTNPQVWGYTRAPTSILADAITILSNSWNDANSTRGLSSRVASNTTVNAAIVSGIVPTNPVDGSYSGGAENFPRFLEDWSRAALTYYGSMVELYKSQQSAAEWPGTGSVYNPPTRQWYFDNNFKTTPPPGSLMIYSYVKGKWSVL